MIKKRTRQMRRSHKFSGVDKRRKPYLKVIKTNSNISVSLIDNEKIIASVFSHHLGINGGNKEGAIKVGEKIADIALSLDYKDIAFHRNGYPYHGRIAALADAARDKGLNF
jgi:large subunit ribosomal protein L18